MTEKKIEVNGDDSFDTWRIGQNFTVVKFLQPLKDFNDAAKQAKYGIIAGKSLLNESNNLIKNRIDGLDKMHFILNLLSFDILFSLNKYQKRVRSGIRKRLNIIDNFLPKIVKHNNDQVNHINNKTIREDMFKVLYNNLLQINSELLVLMNHAGLIFRKNEEFDLDDFMSDIIHRG